MKAQRAITQTIFPYFKFHVFLLSVLCSVVSMQSSLAQDISHNTKEGQAPKSENVHIAFAGGGWRAHVGHSAWVMSLLDRRAGLESAFANVGAISSNSGGSWFSSMLAYSSAFTQAIEAENAIAKWGTAGPDATGWLGQQQYLFDQAPCHLLSGDALTICVFDYYTGGLANVAYWHKVIKKLVFHDNPINQLLSGQRQAWARDKALLFAASMLTKNAVLGESGWRKQYYQACIAPTTPSLNGGKGGSCVGHDASDADVTPVTFASMPKATHWKAPLFFSATRLRPDNEEFNVGYSEKAWFWPDKASAKIANPIATDNVPVIIAASASSAAAGFAASESVTGSWEESYLGSDEAISFRLEGGLKHIRVNGMNASTLSADKTVQIADGGAVDNSAVAQLVSFLQHNDQADDFNIVAFDNVQELFRPKGKGAAVGIDIANLFGKGLWKGKQICSGKNGKGDCVTVPKLQIFELAPLLNTQAIWSATASTDKPPKVVNQLIYTQYPVTTIDNLDHGIKAGSSGTLHAFTAVWSNANTAPKSVKKSGDFKVYDEMLTFIHRSLSKKYGADKTGVEYLEQALGL